MSALRALTTAFVLFAATGADACEPCLTKSPLKRTIEQASVIALVHNRDQNSSATLESGPELVELNVEKVIKGDPGGQTVKVHSWYGECVFGVHMNLNAHAIVMLQEMNDPASGGWDGTYKLVEGGCSEGQIDVKYGELSADNKRMTVDQFVAQYVK